MPCLDCCGCCKTKAKPISEDAGDNKEDKAITGEVNDDDNQKVLCENTGVLKDDTAKEECAQLGKSDHVLNENLLKDPAKQNNKVKLSSQSSDTGPVTPANSRVVGTDDTYTDFKTLASNLEHDLEQIVKGKEQAHGNEADERNLGDEKRSVKNSTNRDDKHKKDISKDSGFSKENFLKQDERTLVKKKIRPPKGKSDAMNKTSGFKTGQNQPLPSFEKINKKKTNKYEPSGIDAAGSTRPESFQFSTADECREKSIDQYQDNFPELKKLEGQTMEIKIDDLYNADEGIGENDIIGKFYIPNFGEAIPHFGRPIWPGWNFDFNTKRCMYSIILNLTDGREIMMKMKKYQKLNRISYDCHGRFYQSFYRGDIWIAMVIYNKDNNITMIDRAVKLLWSDWKVLSDPATSYESDPKRMEFKDYHYYNMISKNLYKSFKIKVQFYDNRGNTHLYKLPE